MSSMFIKHPLETGVLEISRYAQIKPCTVNLTHVDFYLTPHNPKKKRGNPDYILVFDDQKERDAWFKKFSNSVTKDVY